MFPFLGGPSDLRTALELLEQVREGLVRSGVDFGEGVPIGVNIEVPSAALTADLLAGQVDFFSVGTNDLIQYLLAVDRADPGTSALYESLHPAVLRIIEGVVAAAERHQVTVAVCGEMAAEPLPALVLLGLGVRELSMSPAAIPRVKAAVRCGKAAELRRLAQECLTLPTAVEIEEMIRRQLGALGSEAPA
jgi:phosphotransferase system enzyme I (PtsI)